MKPSELIARASVSPKEGISRPVFRRDANHDAATGIHDELDAAVASAYGWPADAANDASHSNPALLELNRQIIAGDLAYTGPDHRRFGSADSEEDG